MAREDLARAIKQRDVGAIVRLLFHGNPPAIRSGFRTETELWDYKRDCPQPGREHANAWADLSVEVLAFHNNNGGVLVFGMTNDFAFHGATTRLDSKLINDQLRRYLGDRIWVEFHREFIQPDQRYLGIAIVPPRGAAPERFKADAPVVNGQRRFLKGDVAIRERDSNRVLSRNDADRFVREVAAPTLGEIYAINEPFYRVLNPEYEHFVARTEPCHEIENALRDPRAAVAAVTGIGGVGKTALATWAAIRAYEHKLFSFIISTTAKDRELTPAGIKALDPGLKSFEALLDAVLEVLGFPDYKQKAVDDKETEVRSLLQNANGLLYVDNLETVDDPRIIRFLDTLPVGVRALTTSRRTSVRASVHPIDLGFLTEGEMVRLINALGTQPAFSYVDMLSHEEKIKIGRACDGIPLAIRWAIASSKSPGEAIASAESITGSRRRGEELLEFCFRRVFDAMSNAEKAVLQVLSLFQRAMPAEAVLVGANLPNFKLLDATVELVADAVVQRLFDPEINDYSYTLLPITRAFVYAQVARQPDLEQAIRRRLSDWYEARDIRDEDERLVVREIRQGKSSSESALVDLAQAAVRRGDISAARALYEQALARNPRSWKAARLLAELHRHQLGNRGEALRLYEQAAANAPSRGIEKAVIFREWGMLLRDSGDPSATDLALEKFEVAHAEAPNDLITTDALARMLDRKGTYSRIVQLLEPVAMQAGGKTRELMVPLLLKAYQRTGNFVKAAELKARIEEQPQL